MKNDNERVLKFGLRQAQRIIEAKLQKSLMDTAEELLERVAANRGFTGFTGNTQTSYACGVYVNGQLKHVAFQKNWTAPTVRMKVRRGRIVHLEEPYEGDPRTVYGVADIVENHGKELSLRLLEEYRAPKKGIALMMTTGTEYSEYIEANIGDVLGLTCLDAPQILEKNWKKLDDKFWGRA